MTARRRKAYKHLKAETLNVDDLNYSQRKLWITSFLYGLFRPSATESGFIIYLNMYA